MSKKVLIGGGSGLVGQRLTKLLIDKGYEVAHLSRSTKSNHTPIIQWSVSSMKLDHSKIEPFDYIINLTGAGVIDESWTQERKKVIIDSRVKSTELLAQAIQKNKRKPKVFVSASAIGLYGIVSSEKVFTEEDSPGTDFLAETCVLWENSVEKIKNLGIPSSLIRIGIVLAKEGGALKEMSKPINYFAGAPLGSGKQYMPWIHIDDLCRIFIHALEQNLEGPFNAVAPKPVNNKTFTQLLAKTLKKPLWLPNVPSFVMKLILGARALLVLEGSRVSCKKIQKTGFTFQFDELEKALLNIYQR